MRSREQDLPIAFCNPWPARTNPTFVEEDCDFESIGRIAVLGSDSICAGPGYSIIFKIANGNLFHCFLPAWRAGLLTLWGIPDQILEVLHRPLPLRTDDMMAPKLQPAQRLLYDDICPKKTCFSVGTAFGWWYLRSERHSRIPRCWCFVDKDILRPVSTWGHLLDAGWTLMRSNDEHALRPAALAQFHTLWFPKS